MLNIKSIITLLVLVVFSKVFAQRDTIYADENGSKISKSFFYEKMNAPLYTGFRYETDTLVLEKIKFSHYFGKLSPVKKNQLFQLLSLRNKIDTTKTLLIHYQDTLKAIHEFPKKNSIIYKDSIGNIVTTAPSSKRIDLNEFRNIKTHIHQGNYSSFISATKRCLRYYKKYRETVGVLHFYDVNNGHPEQVKNIKWYKDYGSIIKRLFLKKNQNMRSLIIKPSGEFFIDYGSNYDISPLDILKPDRWDAIKEKFYQDYKTLNNTHI